MRRGPGSTRAFGRGAARCGMLLPARPCRQWPASHPGGLGNVVTRPGDGRGTGSDLVLVGHGPRRCGTRRASGCSWAARVLRRVAASLQTHRDLATDRVGPARWARPCDGDPQAARTLRDGRPQHPRGTPRPRSHPVACHHQHQRPLVRRPSSQHRRQQPIAAPTLPGNLSHSAQPAGCNSNDR
jgi:hypothetical protein